jgi:uncharacterized membrane protein
VSHPDTEPGRERDLDRLLTFIDAVVAIAMTLLVLPLVDLTLEVTPEESVADLLRTNQPVIWSFLLSFVVISRFWFAQHHTFRHVLVPHGRLSALLLLWALTIVFLPFPTALVARAGDQATTKVLYIGTMVVSTASIGLMNWVIIRNPQITDGVGLPVLTPAVVDTVLFLLALVISLAFPAIGYLALLLLFLEPLTEKVLARVRR